MRYYFVLIALILFGCGEEGGLKGTLRISITDAPIDATDVKAVNVVITNVEGYQNGKWKSFKNFEQPVGVNLLAYSEGKSILLIDQYISPGEFTAVRLSFNVANRNSSLIVNPQSNITFKNGTSAPLYMAQGLASEVILDTPLGISSRGFTDITFDFDLRKSIKINERGEYVIDPFVRVIHTNKSGHVRATIVSSNAPKQVVVYAYQKGSFKTEEKIEVADRVAFYQSVTSTSIKSTSFTLGFLEPGDYDLVFAKHSDSGNVVEILGMQTGIPVRAGEQTQIEIDIENLNPS